MKEPYILYIQTFGKVQSGTKIEDKDYGVGEPPNMTEFEIQGMLAIALATSDVKRDVDIRTKSDFEERIKRLLEK